MSHAFLVVRRRFWNQTLTLSSDHPSFSAAMRWASIDGHREASKMAIRYARSAVVALSRRRLLDRTSGITADVLRLRRDGVVRVDRDGLLVSLVAVRRCDRWKSPD